MKPRKEKKPPSPEELLKCAQNEELRLRFKRYLSERKSDDDDCIQDEWLLYILDYNPIKRILCGTVAFVLILLLLGVCGWCFKLYLFDAVPEQECLFNYPVKEFPLVKDLLATARKCSVCKTVHKIAKVQGISRTEFERKYAYTKRPVVVTDATKNWTAVDEFSFAYLKGVFRGKALDAVSEACQFFPYKSNFESLKDVFEMPPSRAYRAPNTEPWYVGWSNCHMKAADELRKHYSRPYFLPQYSEASKVDWIFMGSPGYGANMHLDDVSLPSWQAQLKGRKVWTLQPPYECRHECPNKLQVVVNPGDIIVLDTNYWYHGTEIIGEDTSIVIGTEFD